jgi:hypothetical protein
MTEYYNIVLKNVKQSVIALKTPEKTKAFAGLEHSRRSSMLTVLKLFSANSYYWLKNNTER